MIWSFSPNWSTPYSVIRTYATEILLSYAGREQRRAGDKAPRRSYEFAVSESTTLLKAFLRFLWRSQAQSFLVADFSRYAVLSGTLSVGGSSIAVTSVPRWLFSGAKVALGYESAREYLTVDHVTSGVVYFSTAATIAHPSGDRMWCAVSVRTSDNVSISRPSSATGNATVALDQVPGSETYANPPSAPVTFNAREVFQVEPDWSNDVTTQFQHPVNTVDYGTGVTSVFAPIGFNTRLFTATYVGMSRPEMEAIEDVFDRCRGRAGEFYMPTWENDIPLGATASSGATTIMSLGREIYDAYLNDTVMTAIYVEMISGAVFYRLVDHLSLSGGNTIVTLTTGLPYALDPAQVRLISWMPVCRFASDSLTTEWLTSDIGRAQIAIQTLESLAPE